jgi:hypothetical protein
VAFRELTPDQRSYLAASVLADSFGAEDREDVRTRLTEAGIAAADVERAIQESRALDPEPAATLWLDLARRIDRAALLEAGRVFQQAVRDLHAAAASVKSWPASNVMVLTDLGRVRIATRTDENFTDECLLILQPGGKNIYGGKTGAANGLGRHRLSAIVDLGGDDEYSADGLLAPGASLFGVSVILDQAGDDVYRASYMGQAAALFGATWLEDLDGDDIYKARALAQAAAVCGAACLADREGNDSYTVGYNGQAFGGVDGFGLLVDEAGQDSYVAGGVEPDHERNTERFVSLAQGFAIGLRPFAGGGVAALIDRAGNDSYVADVYGQGASYWYSAGFLLDLAGHDSYRVHHYGQGSGIHLSHGLLADFAGDDAYTGGVLAQGNAHDFAVGMLFDKAGSDTYTANEHAQGHAMNNSFAWLSDAEGNDAYFARNDEASQGIGNPGGPRDYGSLAVLLDQGGADTYSCGAVNRHALLRPLYGIILDAPASGSKP